MSKKKIKKLVDIKQEIQAIKDMATDFMPRLSTFLNPTVWQSPGTIQVAATTLATSFLSSRVKKLFEEIFNKKDSIDEKVINSEKSSQVLLDLVKFIAQENPDIETWEVAKNIFIKTLQKDVNEQERVSLYELVSICKQLSGTEIRILAGAYKIFKLGTGLGPTGNQRNVINWGIDIAQEIGLRTSEEILRYEDNLVRQKLIMPREMLRGDIQNTWVGAGNSLGHRLTPLGRKLTESFVENRSV